MLPLHTPVGKVSWQTSLGSGSSGRDISVWCPESSPGKENLVKDKWPPSVMMIYGPLRPAGGSLKDPL